MSTTEEVQKPTAEQGVAPAKQAKEKKAKAAPKEKKATKTASHPPYFEMIKEALLALKEKGGSSPHAIAKFMEEKHKSVLPANFRKILGLQLKNSATKGKLIKIKASYKLSESEKKDKTAAAKPAAKKTAAAAKPAAKKTAAAKPAAKKTATAKKTTATKPAAKKTTAAATKKPAAGTKRKAEAAKKKPAAKKAVAKKATPVKAKQPKSIKSPAAKRARRATAAV